jgi:hypothetical protein
VFGFVALTALAVTIVDRQASLPVWAAVVTWLLIIAGMLLAAGQVALFSLKRRTRRRAVAPVLAAPLTALEPQPVTERTPA